MGKSFIVRVNRPLAMIFYFAVFGEASSFAKLHFLFFCNGESRMSRKRNMSWSKILEPDKAGKK
jgi:hypothetical protein